MKICIVGGGIMGITLGYLLTKRGLHVEIFEASSTLGGLAGPLYLEDGTAVDRFYHAILSSDSYLQQLCQELGISDTFRFNQTKMGFFHRGKTFAMNGLLDFLRFPPLGWIDRFRLGLTILAAQRIQDWQQLENVSVEEWLLRWSGSNTYANIWKPMLRAKFDGSFANVPATWIWSRLVRMKSTRNGAAQKEQAGHLIGGYITLLRAMAEKIEAGGGLIHLNSPIQEILVEGERMTGVRVQGQTLPYDAVVVTMQPPILSKLIPNAAADHRASYSSQEYLGIICPLLVMSKPLTGYWTINITDESVPFTGIIETTAYIDPAYVGGHHLIYLPKYTLPNSEWQRKSDDEIKQIWLANLQRMFPDFSLDDVRYFLVHRERYVEPLHGLQSSHLIPAIRTPIQDLYLATTSQIYPALTNGESVSRHAHDAAELIANDLLALERNRPLQIQSPSPLVPEVGLPVT
jgi:protoporphyrinogen oxidase